MAQVNQLQGISRGNQFCVFKHIFSPVKQRSLRQTL